MVWMLFIEVRPRADHIDSSYRLMHIKKFISHAGLTVAHIEKLSERRVLFYETLENQKITSEVAQGTILELHY